MATAAAADLLTALRQSRLLSSAQLDDLARTGKRNPRSLSRQLVERGWLTPYQADLLLQGRCDDLVMEPYLILERLGEGKFGQIYKARHRSLDRTVTIKVLRKDLLADYDILARFYREVRLVSQVNHPNIVHAYDAGPIGGQHMIVMEYVVGFDLARLSARRGPLPAGEACEYVRQAAVGLQHAHERGLVHRDIQPSNLLLTPPLRSGVPGSGSAVVKLLDLGLGRLLRKAPGDSGASQLTLLGNGDMEFTDYTSPEQAIDFHGADIRADIFGLGATLFFLLAARPPEVPDKARRLIRLEQVDPPALDTFRQDLPPGLAGVYAKMTAWRAQDRYQTPAEVAQALAPYCSAHTPPVAIPLPSPASAEPRRRKAVIAAAAALLLLLLGVGAWAFLGKSSKDAPRAIASAPKPVPSAPRPPETPPIAITPREPVVSNPTRSGPAGTWKWSTTINNNTREYTLKLRLEGDRLSGTMTRDGMDIAIQEGRYRDGDVFFTATYERNGQKIATRYTGKLTGDEIRGRSEFNIGGQARSRDWDAHRSKD